MSNYPWQLGEKTTDYPFGYGFCQCGCHKLTQLQPNGIWASYIYGHRVIRPTSESQDSPEIDLPQQVDKNSQELLVNQDASKIAMSSAAGQVDRQAFRSSGSAQYPDVRLNSVSEGYFFPERGLLDVYTELSAEYGQLRREMQVLQLEVSRAAKLIDDLWIDGGESKALVAEKLKVALSRLSDAIK